MDLQTMIVAVCIAGALVFLAWDLWRTWKPRPGSSCGGGCGCARPTPASGERITLSTRKLSG